MTGTTWSERDHMRPSTPMMQEAVGLLRAYPAISGYEVRLLAEIVPELSILETGLMASDDGLAAKLARFREEQGHLIRSPVWHGAAVVTVLTVFLAVVIFGLVSA